MEAPRARVRADKVLARGGGQATLDLAKTDAGDSHPRSQGSLAQASVVAKPSYVGADGRVLLHG